MNMFGEFTSQVVIWVFYTKFPKGLFNKSLTTQRSNHWDWNNEKGEKVVLLNASLYQKTVISCNKGKTNCSVVWHSVQFELFQHWAHSWQTGK